MSEAVISDLRKAIVGVVDECRDNDHECDARIDDETAEYVAGAVLAHLGMGGVLTTVAPGVVLAQTQARATTLSLIERLVDVRYRYAPEAGVERAKGFSDAIRSLQHIVDGFTESIGDGMAKVAP